jgi:DnaJ-class molecular chaperone
MTPQESPRHCNDTLVCQRCDGSGVHMHETFHEVECEICDGTGDCPCVHDADAHREKAPC